MAAGQSRTSTSRRPWYNATVAGMASYIDSATIVSSGAGLVIYMNSGLDISNAELGVLSFALTMGIAVGAAVGGRLGDRFGRKPVFSVTMVAIIVSMLLFIFGGGFGTLLAASIIAGLATGADLPVSIATIAEGSPDRSRGKMVSFSQVLWVVGVVVTLAIQSIVGNWGHLGGQILFAHIAIVAAVVLVLRLMLPESPVWLAAQQERSADVPTERAERATVRDLLQDPYLKPFLALLIFYPLVNLAANTGGQFGTFLWVETAGTTPAFAGQVGLAMWGLSFVLALVFMRVVDTRHRMLIFYVGSVAYVLCTLIPTVAGVTVATLIIWQILLMVGNSFAFEAILKVWTQESFPTLLRSTAQGTIIGVARVFAAVLALVTPSLAAAGPQVLFGVLTALITVGLAAAILGFRKGSRNEFEVEDRIVAADGASGHSHP